MEENDAKNSVEKAENFSEKIENPNENTKTLAGKSEKLGDKKRKRDKKAESCAEKAAEAVERAMGRGVRALQGARAGSAAVPRHLAETQTVLLTEHVLAVSKHLEKMQRLLRAQVFRFRL